MTDSDAQPGQFTDFACPRCGDALEALHCSACKVTFPTMGGIPWLFAEPNAALAEWRTRFDLAIKLAQQQADACRTSLKQSDLSPATRSRITHLEGAHSAHVGELNRVLAPLMSAPVAGNIETHLALKTRLPSTQGLTSYAANLHRDWSWGAEENELSFDRVAHGLGDIAGKRLLVLGAGGGRLAYDLHQRLEPLATVALDVNPFLLLVTKALACGETATLTEFPLAPKRAEYSAVTRTLAAPKPARPGLQLVLADALRAPFPADSFDAVVTPWFVDIVAAPFADTCGRVNTLLADAGTWVSFGSLAFTSPQIDEALSFEEAVDTVAAHGFNVLDTDETDIPYMSCPESRHGRIESVITLKAVKAESAPAPERHDALPDWIVRGTAPVPATPAFKTQATTTRIYAFIMSMIDGKRSIKDMARLMEEQRLMTRKEAEAALRGFLTKMLDESRSSGGL